MPAAARISDTTSHPGMIVQGSPNVLIEGLMAARLGDMHVCTMPPTAGPHPPNPIAMGSGTVLINGMPAARQSDMTGCGALIVLGAATVIIGG